MLKISKEIKRRDLPRHIQEELETFSSFHIKMFISVFTFLMLDFLIIIPLSFPIIKPISYVTLPLIALINLWAIWLLIRNKIYTEMESILFLGCLGLVGSFCYFMLTIKYAILLEIESPLYYISMVLAYIFLLFISWRNQARKYISLDNKPEKKTADWQTTIVAIVVPAGYIVANLVMGLSDTIVLSFMMAIFLFLAYFFIYLFSRSFHKYLFIKKNMHVANFENNDVLREARGLKAKKRKKS